MIIKKIARSVDYLAAIRDCNVIIVICEVIYQRYILKYCKSKNIKYREYCNAYHVFLNFIHLD